MCALTCELMCAVKWPISPAEPAANRLPEVCVSVGVLACLCMSVLRWQLMCSMARFIR